MPIYDYQCDDCGHVFEVIRKRSEAGPAECPSCGKPDPRRAISATSFQLKGSGWYVTDYKAKNPGATPPATSTSESGGGSESTTTPAKESKSSDSSDPAPASKEVA